MRAVCCGAVQLFANNPELAAMEHLKLYQAAAVLGFKTQYAALHAGAEPPPDVVRRALSRCATCSVACAAPTVVLRGTPGR